MSVQNQEIYQEIVETLQDQKEPEARSVIRQGLFLSKTLTVPLIVINDTAVFVVIGLHGSNILNDIETITARYHLTDPSYFFVQDPDKAMFWDEDYDQLIPVEDLYTGFFNVYFPVISGNMPRLIREGISPAMCAVEEEPSEYSICDERGILSQVRRDAILHAIDEDLKKPLTVKDSLRFSLQKYYTSGDQKYVRKLDAFGREEYCKVSDIDPDEFYKLVLFGGMFGLHRFQDKQYAKGIGYLLTCGMFGMFWLIDLLIVLLGNYRLSDGSYVDHPNYKKAFLLLPAGLLFGAACVAGYYFISKHLYAAAVGGFAESKTAERIASKKAQEMIGQIAK